MRFYTRPILTAAFLLVVAVGTANAVGTLGLDWLSYGGSARVEARYNGSTVFSPNGAVGLGSFHGTYTEDGTSVNTGAIYCVDLFHSFSGTPASWEVTRRVIPPDPINPPPWNTHEAVWAFHKYNGLGWSANGTKAAGLQLALWELTHDQDWRIKYSQSTQWYDANSNGSSDFYITQVNSTIRDYATNILDDVYSVPEVGIEYAYYYDPAPSGNPMADYTGMQGFMGEVPEPSTFLLMGMGLLAAAGAAYRRRNR